MIRGRKIIGPWHSQKIQWHKICELWPNPVIFQTVTIILRYSIQIHQSYFVKDAGFFYPPIQSQIPADMHIPRNKKGSKTNAMDLANAIPIMYLVGDSSLVQRFASLRVL